jgi:RNA polymerase sigma factor (sigma-70 family)
MLRALERFESLSDRNRFRAWLVRMTWRLAIDRRRADWRRVGRETQCVSGGVTHADAERELIAREQAAHLHAAVEQLPAKLRAALVLGHIEEHSLDEVAAMLQLPAGTVKSRSFHARRRLKRSLVKAGVALGLVACASIVVQRWQLADVTDWPAVAKPVAMAAAPPIDLAGVRVNTVQTKAPAEAARKAEPRDEIPVLSAPVVDVPVVTVPLVRVPVLQIPVVETTSSVPSGVMEKQR